jgi:beta-glucosidase
VQFPREFVWGVATSAYQIEGAARADGRGESIWDRFSRTTGKVKNGDTGDIACDHYHRYEEDIALMAALGVPSYRFSVAWPRVVPDGAGPVNRKGLDFYSRLVDRLLARGIMPAVTLYHWDLPQALQDRGGWANRETADFFAQYAEIVYKTLGDRVPLWITHNEPFCAGILGYEYGVHAPGLRDRSTALRAVHHILLSHGKAVQAYRALGLKAPIGITLDSWTAYPASDSEADRAAAHLFEGTRTRWFFDPVLKGRYPDDVWSLYARLGADLNFVREGDLQTIAEPIEFYGLNWYSRNVVKAESGRPEGFTTLPPSAAVTDLGWEIVPHALTDLLVRLKHYYGDIPVYITENGCAYHDGPGPDGEVRDARRVAYFQDHIAAVGEALARGVDVRGYYAWSLLDNFEWHDGYTQRFGLVWVDYATQARIPKESARFYSRIIQANGLHAV